MHQVYDHYYRYDEITAILKSYAEKHPGYASLSSIGTTPEGREIWIMSVTDGRTGAPEDKPAA